MSAVDKAKLDLGIFSAIMSHWDADDVDANAIAEKFDTAQQKVAAIVYSAKHRPRAYTELSANGASPGQIPPWFMRPSGEGAVTTPPETPPPGGMGQVGPPGPRRAPAMGGIALDLDAPTRHGGNNLGAVYDGVRLQSERLSNLGIIRDQGGRYLKASTNPDGFQGFVDVDPVEVE